MVVDGSTSSSKKKEIVVALSAKDKNMERMVIDLLEETSDAIHPITFNEMHFHPDILREVDFILPIGGDGSVSHVIREFYRYRKNLNLIKPIVPVVRPESIGYLRELSIGDEEEFKERAQRLLTGDYKIVQRRILRVEWLEEEFVAVNEVYLTTNPTVGVFKVSLNGEIFTETMADGIMVATSIGSTAWSLSLSGTVNLNEDALILIPVGGSHGTANFILPCQTITIECTLKNPVITKDTVWAYHRAREMKGLQRDANALGTLEVVYSPRILADGKVIAFIPLLEEDNTIKIEIYSDYTVPFVTFGSLLEKARILTQNVLNRLKERKQIDDSS